LKTTKDLQEAINVGENIRDKWKTMVKVFQALRIAVNGELMDVKALLEKMPDKISQEGVGMVITFHSLEANTVKH
jgi:16S rRNA (cytosine1402-N4)-methyltransferase